jgi:hypothetical protein
MFPALLSSVIVASAIAPALLLLWRDLDRAAAHSQR